MQEPFAENLRLIDKKMKEKTDFLSFFGNSEKICNKIFLFYFLYGKLYATVFISKVNE